MSTVTIAQLASSQLAFKELYALPLRPIVSLRVGKAIKFAEKHLADYEAARMKLVEQFAEKGGDGKLKVENNAYVLSDKEKFAEGMAALLAEDYELPPSVKQIDVEHFDAPLPPRVCGPLDWLIIEPVDTAE